MAKRKRNIPKIFDDMGEYAHICSVISEHGRPSATDPLWEKNPILNIVKIPRGNDFCYVSIERDRIVVVFKQSDDIEDWKSNKDFEKNDFDIHNGFYNDASEFWEELGPIIEQAILLKKTIYFTGYSRGGSLTFVTAKHFCTMTGYPMEVYPIVDPRIGGKECRKACNRIPLHVHHLHQRGGIADDYPFKFMGYVDIGHITYLKPKWWYYLPSLAIRWTKIHLDWYDNLKRQV